MADTSRYSAGESDDKKALRRSSWKADAIRRGRIKISGPLPMTEEDSEQVLRRHSMPFQKRVSELSVQEPVEQKALPSEVQPIMQSKTAMNGSGTDEPPARPTTSPAMYKEKEPHPIQHNDYHLPNRTRSTLVSHSASPVPSRSKSKRASSLKGVFRKMFGRKPREDGNVQPQVPKHEYHRSDPGLMKPNTPRKHVISSPTPQFNRESLTRSQNFDANAALVSHLPFPMNVNAPETMRALSASGPLGPPRRRNTISISSVALSAAEVAELNSMLAEVKKPEDLEDGAALTQCDSKEIGVAISSPIQMPLPVPVPMPLQLRRRSRSVGALNEILAQGGASFRAVGRRSSEIRYWRESAIIKPEDVDFKIPPPPEEGPLPTEPEETPAQLSDESNNISMDTTMADVSQPEEAKEEIVEDTKQTDDGASLHSALEEQSSIEDRMARLEHSNQYLEKSVRRLTNISQRQTVILEHVPKAWRNSGPQSASTSRDSSVSTAQIQQSNGNIRSVPQQQNCPPTPPSPPLSTSNTESPTPPSRIKEQRLSPHPRYSNPLLSNPPEMSILDSKVEGAGQEIIEDPIPVEEPTPVKDPIPRSQSEDIPERISRVSVIQRPKTELFYNAAINSAADDDSLTNIYNVLRHERSERKMLQRQVSSLQQELLELRNFITQELLQGRIRPHHQAWEPMITNDRHTVTIASADARGPSPFRRKIHGIPEDELRRQTIISRFSGFDTEDGDDEEDEDEKEKDAESGATVGGDEQQDTPKKSNNKKQITENVDGSVADDQSQTQSRSESAAPSVQSPEVWATPVEEFSPDNNTGFPMNGATMISHKRSYSSTYPQRTGGGVTVGEGGMF